MDINRLIHDFADGTLPPEYEEKLFITLSSSPELRNELKSSMALTNAVKSDTKAFTPSASSKSAIFSNVGLDVPQAVTPISYAMNKFIYGTAGVGIGAITVFLLMYSSVFDSTENFDQAMMSTGLASRDYPDKPELVMECSAPLITDTVTKYVYLYPEAFQHADYASSEIIDQTKPLVSPYYNLTIPSRFESYTPNPQISYISDNSGFNSSFIYDVIQPEKPIGITLEFASNQAWDFPAATITPESFQPFNKLSMTVFGWEPIKGLNFGVDFRRENFYQEFDGIRQDSLEFAYAQQPNFTSYGVVARYFPEFLKTEKIKPFVQIGAAMNKAGAIARGMGGIWYKIDDHISFSLGLEGNILYFRHQDKNFHSKKMNLNYGISYEF